MKATHPQTHIARLLKGFTVLAALLCAFVFFFYLPLLGQDLAQALDAQALYLPCLIFAEVIALLVFLALWQFWKLCRCIGSNRSFSMESAAAVTAISRLALAAGVLFVGLVIALISTGILNAAWFIVLFFCVCAALGISLLCWCLSQLIRNAAELKEQTDLTI
jgi:hypothetical protein